MALAATARQSRIQIQSWAILASRYREVFTKKNTMFTSRDKEKSSLHFGDELCHRRRSSGSSGH
jgi:hypothetical protein